MILNNRFEEPYNKFPGDGPIQLLSKPIVKSKLSKKFWLYSQYLESQNLINKEEEIFNDNNEEEYSNNYINNEQSIKIKYKRPKMTLRIIYNGRRWRILREKILFKKEKKIKELRHNYSKKNQKLKI